MCAPPVSLQLSQQRPALRGLEPDRLRWRRQIDGVEAGYIGKAAPGTIFFQLRTGVAILAASSLRNALDAILVTSHRSIFPKHLVLALGWLALLGMLMSSVAPSVTRLRSDDHAAILAELCSTRGALSPLLARLTSKALTGAQAPGDRVDSEGADVPLPVAASDDCPYCTLHHPLALTAAAHVLPSPAPARLVPLPYLRDAATRHAWRTAQPRGPPAA